MSVYLYDGHGSVVGLANESGVVTDTYSYDAFGNLLKSKGSTKNCYRYCGEQFDETTGLYYLRARYMDTSTGRFISQDSYAGSISDPISLHKYLYANANPVMYSDPSGYIGLLDTVCASAIGNVLFYSASAGLITFGMGLIRQLREIDNGIRKTIDWSNLIKEIIFSTALAAGLSCLSLLILPLITNLLAKAIICYVLAGTGLFFGGVGLKNCYNDISAKNYDLAVLEALRKKLCKNNQPQKNDFVARAADQSLSFLFQYKLNTAICQAPDAKYPDATERSAVKSGYFAAASVQPVRIHYLKLTEHLAPVPKRHRPFFGYLRCCQIQSL